jgi:hypothetical protein
MNRRRSIVPWVLCAVSLTLYAVSNVLRFLLRNDVPAPHTGWVEGIIGAIGFVGIPIVGALLVSRLPGNPYGWVWCAAGVSYGLSDISRPLDQAVDGPVWLGWILESSGFLTALGMLVLVFLLFPTGRPPGRRWRWVARAAVTIPALLMVMVLFFDDPADPMAVGPWAVDGRLNRYLGDAVVTGLFALFFLVLAAMVSLVLRFRRAGPVQRRQLAWFLYATVVIASLLVVDGVLGVLPGGVIGAVVNAVAFTLLPVAVGVAVLRYRLYEIDRIVSRTVSYGLLSAALIGMYLLVVALLRPLLEPLAGSSTLAVAGSTLAVAAVFNPARRRLQAAVDRRFDRARYDAARAVEAFAARLRDQVDLDQITTGLRDTVTATVAPGSVAVWLRPGPGVTAGPVAATPGP